MTDSPKTSDRELLVALDTKVSRLIDDVRGLVDAMKETSALVVAHDHTIARILDEQREQVRRQSTLELQVEELDEELLVWKTRVKTLAWVFALAAPITSLLLPPLVRWGAALIAGGAP
jgi:urease accessory protein UreH